jgi:hypothetical protein
LLRSLSRNQLGAEGAAALAPALAANGGLTSIDLSANLLCGTWTDGNGNQLVTYTAEGITAIADALRVNGGLTSINLSGNHLTNYGTDMTGIKELAAALGVNGALTTVWTSAHMNSLELAQAPNTEPSVCALGLAARSLKQQNWRAL